MIYYDYMEIEELEKRIDYLIFILERKKNYQKIPLTVRIESCLNARAQQLIPLNKIEEESEALRFMFNEEEFKIWEKMFNKEMGEFVNITKRIKNGYL